MTFYTVLLFIHIFSAILGMGPGFSLIPIVRSAKTMGELRHAYAIKHHLHRFVMAGGTLLLLTGLLMGWRHPHLFQMGWYVTSLILFLIALSVGPLLLKPRTRPIKALLAAHDGDDIPEEYYILSKAVFRYERLLNILFIVIIALMILKPF